LINILDTGFAYSSEKGQDILVTDSIVNRLQDAMARQMFGN